MKDLLKIGSASLAAILLVFGLITGCTDNSRAKRWGGTITVNIPKGQKFIEATWKNDELWYVTRPMRPGETAETWTFQEKSSFGMMEGKVIFKEQEPKAEK
jgi:hypothetical protein